MFRLGSANPVITAHNDSRFDSKKHFIKDDVNAEFLKKHNIDTTIKNFKERLQNIPYEFKAWYGNILKATGKAKVYNIEKVKQHLEEFGYGK